MRTKHEKPKVDIQEYIYQYYGIYRLGWCVEEISVLRSNISDRVYIVNLLPAQRTTIHVHICGGYNGNVGSNPGNSVSRRLVPRFVVMYQGRAKDQVVCRQSCTSPCTNTH